MQIPDEVKQACLNEAMDYLLVRSEARMKALGEIFTPTRLVLEILEALPDKAWEDGKTYIDPAAGNGQFLTSVLLIKLALGHRDALSTVYGVELMLDNVEECKRRLIDIAGDTPENWETVNWNIRCADSLKFNFDAFDRK